MILEIFKDSFEYSFKDKKSLLKIGILLVLSIFLVPVLFILGYSYRITLTGLNGMINGDDPLPKFENWRNLLLEGVKFFIAKFSYLLPGIMILNLDTNFGENKYIFTNPLHFSSELGFKAISIIILIILYLFSIVATTHMINNNGSLKYAFKFREILEVIKSIEVYRYLKFYLGYIVLLIGITTTTLLLIFLMSSAIGTVLIALYSSLSLGSSFTIGLTTSLFIISLVFVLFPLFIVFESRSIALIYNMKE